MKRPKRGGEKPLRSLPLPRGVVLHARALDAFAMARIDAAVENDLTAIVRGEAPEQAWDLPGDHAAALVTDHGLRRHYASWMRLVLLATLATERVDGMEEEDGAPSAPSFDLFRTLFEETAFSETFRQVSILLTLWLDEEKNVSGRGLSGVSAAAPSTAPDAAPERTPSSGSPVHEACPSPVPTEESDAALSTSTRREPQPAPSPGGSLAAEEAGASDSAASAGSIGAL